MKKAFGSQIATKAIPKFAPVYHQTRGKLPASQNHPTDSAGLRPKSSRRTHSQLPLLEELNFLSNWRHSNGSQNSEKTEQETIFGQNRNPTGVTSASLVESSNSGFSKVRPGESSHRRSGLLPRRRSRWFLCDYYDGSLLNQHRLSHNAGSLKARCTPADSRDLAKLKASPNDRRHFEMDRRVFMRPVFKRPCRSSRLDTRTRFTRLPNSFALPGKPLPSRFEDRRQLHLEAIFHAAIKRLCALALLEVDAASIDHAQRPRSSSTRNLASRQKARLPGSKSGDLDAPIRHAWLTPICLPGRQAV